MKQKKIVLVVAAVLFLLAGWVSSGAQLSAKETVPEKESVIEDLEDLMQNTDYGYPVNEYSYSTDDADK